MKIPASKVATKAIYIYQSFCTFFDHVKHIGGLVEK
jgi:DNA anti-recombination protein RmuC